MTGSFNENFWGDKINISGTIENKATVANFKDVIIEVTYYSKTKSVIRTERYAIYDFFNAHSNKKFKISITNYVGTESLNVAAVYAKTN